MARRKRKVPTARLYVQAPAHGKSAVRRHRDLTIIVSRGATVRQKRIIKRKRKARRRPGHQGLMGFVTSALKSAI